MNLWVWDWEPWNNSIHALRYEDLHKILRADFSDSNSQSEHCWVPRVHDQLFQHLLIWSAQEEWELIYILTRNWLISKCRLLGLRELHMQGLFLSTRLFQEFLLIEWEFLSQRFSRVEMDSHQLSKRFLWESDKSWDYSFLGDTTWAASPFQRTRSHQLCFVYFPYYLLLLAAYFLIQGLSHHIH